MSTSNSFYKTYEQVKDQQSKDFAFLQKHLLIKNRIASHNTSKLSSLQERNRINLKRFSNNVILNNQLQNERCQRIKNKHNMNRNALHFKSTSPSNSSSMSHSFLLQSPLYKTRTPSSLSQTNFLITKTRNNNENLRKSYESLIYTRLRTFTANKNKHMHQIRNKFNAYNTFVHTKMQKHKVTKLISNQKLKDDLDMKSAEQLHRYTKYIHNKAQSLNEYNDYLRQRSEEVKTNRNELRQHNVMELKKIVNDVTSGCSYDEQQQQLQQCCCYYTAKNSCRLTSGQLKLIRKEKEAKEKVEIFKRNEMINKQNKDKQILINEFRKFNKICKREKDNQNRREILLRGVIRKQQRDDYDMKEIKKDIEHVKDKSIYKHL